MVREACRELSAVDTVVTLAGRPARRAVLVRSPAGGGARQVVERAAAVLHERCVDVHPVMDLRRTPPDELLLIRSLRRSHMLLLAVDDGPLPTLAAQLVDYLRPHVHDVAPATLAEVRLLLEARLGAGAVTDELASAVLLATAGRLGDVVDVAEHLGGAHPGEVQPGGTTVLDLSDFAPAIARHPDPDDVLLRWAVAAAEGAPALAARHEPARERAVHPVDATALRDRLRCQPGGGRRRAALLRELCEGGGADGAPALGPEEQVVVASWWCELAVDEPMLSGPELQALLPGVLAAVDLNRWQAAGRIAERLWRTTRAPQAATGVAAALARATPTPLLDELLAAHPDDTTLRATAAFSRALWHLYVEHRPAEARAVLEAAIASIPVQSEMCEDGLATIDLHTGDPEAVERRVGDRPVVPGRPTSFALNALALADLVRGRHRRVIERLDAEVDRQLVPGMNLTADRYRFVHAFVLVRSGAAAGDELAELSTELARLHEGALRRGDDWNLGWTAWAAGLHDARAGRSVDARRRLRGAADAFRRAHRPGFADWPTANLVALESLVRGPGATAADLAALTEPAHAVSAERSDALLALALDARSRHRTPQAVASLLRTAMQTAHRQREVVTGHVIAIEQVLAGLVADEPPLDEHADGVVIEATRLVLADPGDGQGAERAGALLVARGWPVLGVRLLAHAAERVRRDDPRRTTRLRQDVRAVCDTFDAPLQPWVLGDDELPTLSAREVEIARAIAGGASRDEVAANLVLSRRTVDSHLQRIYAKLGISSRAELREWLDG